MKGKTISGHENAGGKNPVTERQDRRAEALRANLRRRKLAVRQREDDILVTVADKTQSGDS